MKIGSIAKQPARLLILALMSIAWAGCEHSARNLSLDETAARDACTTFLKAWQEGKTPTDLRPAITGADHEWTSGKKLVAFQFLPDEFNDGTNLHIPVRLTLKSENGKESNSNALYTVGTSPVVTVFRD